MPLTCCETLGFMMRILTVAALSLSLAPAALPHTANFPDPANLKGERVAPRTGRELPVDQGARGLQQLLRKLNTRASLMLIVAHPDDEDGGMLTLYSRGEGARVATLTLTRGEGGQNAMTGDFEDALGLIRTQELLAADRYFGADQMFGTEVDFGFSKTKEEAFSKWTHERVLYDAVRSVRLYRPLVLAAVFIGGVTDGHGQHQVSGEIAQEVFKAAADPTVFPELTREGILPWQPLKVYARVPMQAITAQGLFDYATNQYTPARFTNYVTGEVTTTPPSVDVTVHEGQADPLLSDAGEPAQSYVQFARIGLGLQKTQIGPGVRLAVAGAYDIGYHRYGSRLDAAHQKVAETSFFDGIDTSVEGIATLAPNAKGNAATLLKTDLSQIQHSIQEAQDNLSPERTAPHLHEAFVTTDSLIAALEKMGPELLPASEKASVLHELRIKRVQLNDALALALGLTVDATVETGTSELPVAHPAIVTVRLSSGSSEALHYGRVSVTNGQGDENQVLTNEDGTAMVTAAAPATEPVDVDADMTVTASRPYFSRPGIEQPFYDLREPALRNSAAGVPTLTAWVNLKYQGAALRLGRVVHAGNQPIRFVPELNVGLRSHAEVLPNDHPSFTVPMLIAPASNAIQSERLQAPVGWKVTTQPAPTAQTRQTSIEFRVDAPAKARKTAILRGSVLATGGRSYTAGFRAVGYGDLPRTDFFTPATDRIVPVELKLPTRRRIAYLPGTGDAVPEALASIGLPVTTLTVADLTPGHLQQFDTVILGVRTYNAHPELHGASTAALLDFARKGGNVVVQYQTAEFTSADAPFPLTLGNAEKVIDETDAVRLLSPSATALSAPNALTPADFNGWVEERGHGFLQTWDKQYTALTETHDPGQAPQEGGLISAQLGHGHWTYCAFAIYRQLPEAVPGAFRIFVNLVGLADASTH